MGHDAAQIPLTLSVALSSWTLDVVAIVLTVGLAAVYLRWRRAAPTSGPTWCFMAGLVLWLLASTSAVAVYAPVLFWMRALQVLVFLFVVPFLLALGRPVTTLRAALSGPGQGRLDAAMTSRWARLMFSPLATSAAMLGLPWLLYLTPWYVASMSGPVAAVTRLVLVVVGFAYFYARLQSDVVPRRYPPLLSIGISVVETLGDGILGLVLWLGPLIAEPYYTGLGRTWGPDMRLDQTVGAGILWILGDVVGVPFLMMLMRSMSVHERKRADEVDDALDQAASESAENDDEPAPTLWWESDPQLRDRMRRN